MRERPSTAVRRIASTSRRPRVFRAYTAEEYDGIGQYIKITLSRNAVSAGLRARLGSGDFGTGQTIPEGTPVSVFSFRGQLEVLSMGAK